MDINTIFYFPNSLTFEDYSEKLNAGEISARTIVFADAQKAIYKGGKKYGGLSNQEFHDLVDTLYDNSWISDEINGAKSDIIESSARIDELNSSLIAVTGRLNTEITNRESNIAAKVESMFSDAEWLHDNFPQGVTNWDSGWNSDIEAYLQTVGYWTTDDQNQTVTQWSKLSQSINRVEGSVNSLTTNGTLTEALSTSIEGVIDNKVASLNLGTTYASKSSVTSLDGDVDKIEDVLSWMYSGFSSSASEDKSVAQIQAMGKSGLVSAISDIRTQVDKVANGDFVAQTEVASKVGNTISAMLLESSESNGLAALAARQGADSDNISAILLGITGSSSTADIQTRIGTAMSGFTTSSDIDSAKLDIYTAIHAKDDEDQFISLAAVKATADQTSSSLSSIASTVDDLQRSSINSAGFVAKTELGSAVAELFASSGNAQNATAKANVVAVVADNKSQLNLTATDVNIDGYLNAGNATFKGDIEANSFTTGSATEVGIGVMAGEFNERLANTHKAYFAYDSTQGGVTMWFYQNDEWKRLNLADSAVIDTAESFATATFYVIPDTNITVLPTDLSTVTLYHNRITNKYYNTPDTTDPVVSGTYYSITNYDKVKSVDSYYKNNNTGYGLFVCSVCEIGQNNGSLVKSKSALLSEINLSLATSVQQVTITNGEASWGSNYVQVALAVADYYTSERKAVIAPVILKRTNKMWTPDQTAQYRDVRQGNVQQYYHGESGGHVAGHAISFQGDVYVNTRSQDTLMSCDYCRTTLADALTYTTALDYVNSSGVGTPTSDCFTLQVTRNNPVYPGESNYPYPLSTYTNDYGYNTFNTSLSATMTTGH